MEVKDIMSKYSIPDKSSMLKIFVESGIFQKFPNKFPLNPDAIIDEIDRRLSRNNTACKYIMYKLGEYYGNQEVNNMTSQDKYNGKHIDMFETKYWNKPKYFKIEDDVIISELPLSIEEKEALQKLNIDESSTVGSVRKRMSAWDFSHSYDFPTMRWDTYGPIVTNIIGGYPHEGEEYQLRIARDLVPLESIDDVYNIFKYKTLICALIDRALDTIHERYKTVIIYRYKSHMTFNEIGQKILDVTQCRIMQIEAKAIRMLRHPTRSSGVEFLIKLKEELSPDVYMAINKYLNFRNCYASKIIDVIAGDNLGTGAMLIHRNELYKELMLTKKPPIEFFNELVHVTKNEEPPEEKEQVKKKKKKVADNAVYLEDLGLSARAFNCLRLKEIRTLDDLIDVVQKPDYLMSIRNLGWVTLLEIINKLKSLGYEAMIPDIYNNYFK